MAGCRGWARDIEAAAAVEAARLRATTRAQVTGDALARQEAALERQLARLMRRWAADEHAEPKAYDIARKGIEEDLEAVRGRMRDARRARAANAGAYQPVMVGLIEGWPTFPPGRRRELLGHLIARIEVHRTGARKPARLEIIPVWEDVSLSPMIPLTRSPGWPWTAATSRGKCERLRLLVVHEAVAVMQSFPPCKTVALAEHRPILPLEARRTGEPCRACLADSADAIHTASVLSSPLYTYPHILPTVEVPAPLPRGGVMLKRLAAAAATAALIATPLLGTAAPVAVHAVADSGTSSGTDMFHHG